MNKFVSIIITSYNEEKYIENCLRSLLKQSYKPLEIIAVNDGSTDRTGEIIKRYSLVTSMEQKHQGTALNRNLAVNKAKGDILVFLDSDMTFEKDFIFHLVKPINEHSVKGTFSKLEYVTNWDKPLARCWNRNNIPQLPDKIRVPQNLNEGEDFRAILKSEFNKVKGFDNTGYTDTWSLAKKLGYKPINAPNAIYYHYNPETFSEIFQSAQWIGKREYKVGILGSLISIIRSCIFFSIIKGVYRSIYYHEKEFILFQIVYDLGLTVGVFEKLFFGKVIK